ncbi:PRC-barrel domain-containing protein [Salinarchaeum sp. IM2453]|uniref:PRC-barrel domain-containing protein n=1 Tax=Salinarchaeum sp. IM2453 TaxID=2862870 RepID=UPI001C828418|nr:PRC-barrel domain-containing protein [Salinarchaeum sp. IM2453]QZA89195.1 PRC-barrel domain-containing protein [Salinarchaeum sp. IM2453]
MNNEPQEITALVDLDVYSNSGVYVGKVEDLRIDSGANQVTGLALHRVNDDLFDNDINRSRGVIIPYRWIQAVGDIVIVSDVIERVSDDPEEAEGNEHQN